MSRPKVTLEIDLDRIWGPELWVENEMTFGGRNPQPWRPTYPLGTPIMGESTGEHSPTTVYIVQPNGQVDTVILPQGTKATFSGIRDV